MIEYKPGQRVLVSLPEGTTDPWLVHKQGWKARVVGPATNLADDHVLVEFEPPWCMLGIARVMPVVVLRLVNGIEDQLVYKEQRMDKPKPKIVTRQMVLPF